MTSKSNNSIHARVIIGFGLVLTGLAFNNWRTRQKGLIYEPLFRASEIRHGLPRGLLSRLAWQESRYDAQAVSPKGALGLMQFMPAVARELGIDPRVPGQAIPASAAMLARLFKKFGRWNLALASYNWGEGNVARLGLARAPAETRKYVREILGDL